MEIARGCCPLVSWAGTWGDLGELSGFVLVFFGDDEKYPKSKESKPAAPSAKPCTYHVDTKGSDDGDGSSNKPFRTVQRAVDAAGPGDKVVVRPGIYRGRGLIRRGGLPDKPLILESQRGAILHGGDAVKDWEHLGNGLYKKDGLPYQPYCMVWNDRFVLHVKRKWGGRYIGADDLYFKGDPTPEDWDGIEVLFASEGNTAWVRSRNGDSPNEQEVTVAPRGYDAGTGTVNIVGADHVVVRGFVIKGSDTGVYLERASDNITERNVVHHGKNSVMLHYQTQRCLLRWEPVPSPETPAGQLPTESSPGAAQRVVGRNGTPSRGGIYRPSHGVPLRATTALRLHSSSRSPRPALSTSLRKPDSAEGFLHVE